MRDGACFDEDGTLAGSALDMASAVRNAVRLLGLDLADASRMASRNPAEFLGLDHELGRIARGYFADLVLLDDDLQVLDTWIRGRRSARTRRRRRTARPPMPRLAALVLTLACMAGAVRADVVQLTPRPLSVEPLAGHALRIAKGAGDPDAARRRGRRMGRDGTCATWCGAAAACRSPLQGGRRLARI